MQRLLNTVYLTTDDAWIKKDGANIVVEVDGSEVGRVPLHMLDAVVAFTRIGCSPALMYACAESGITISFVDPNGRFLARVEGPRSGNVLLRREQYRFADDELRSLNILRSIIAAKVANQRTVLLRALRDHESKLEEGRVQALRDACSRMVYVARNALGATTSDTARGYEGEAAALYFSVFNDLVLSNDAAFRFNGRSRRPPLDRVNALLSFLYAMLAHDCRSAAETHGLDPQVGFLHRDRPGRNGLALDLMEELRPVLADRLALTLINRGQLTPEDFLVEDAGGVRMTDDARKRVLVAWQERKREEARHPFFEEQAPLGLFPQLQAQLMARHLRGELDTYPALIWK